MNSGRLTVALFLTLSLILLLVGVLGRIGVLEQWGQQLASQRDTLRVGRPVVHHTDAQDQAPVINTESPDRPLAALETTIAAYPELSTALNLFSSAEILTTLPKPTTLLLPTNAAFTALPPEALTALQNNPATLQAILKHHVIRGRVAAAEIVRFDILPTLNGTVIPVTVAGTTVVGGANIQNVDQPFTNGLIHIIDRVLLPTNNLLQPVIDTPNGQVTVEYKGEFITVVGSAEPFTRIVLTDNGQRFGDVTVSAEGRWQLAGTIKLGEHRLVAYMLNSNPENALPLGISAEITLNVIE